jgi:hypothetical protein
MIYHKYLPLLILVIGVIIFSIGISQIYYEGVKVFYRYVNIDIPIINFVTEWPGNYSVSVNISLEILRERKIVEPTNYIYNVSIPWSNCRGGNVIGLYLSGYRSVGHVSDNISIKIYGCKEKGCELIFDQDIFNLENACVTYPGFVCKTDFNVSDSILNYKYLNFSLIPARGLVIEDFGVGTTLTCTFNYTLKHPELRIGTVTPQPLFFKVPEYIDTSGLRNGLVLSLIGLLLVLISIYIKIYFTAK